MLITGLLVLAGCSETTSVLGRFTTPPRLGLRAAGVVYVASANLDDDELIGRTLARYLRAERGLEVALVDRVQRAELRRQGRFVSGGVVVDLQLRLDEGWQTDWGQRPETVCGPFGCYTSNRLVTHDMRTLSAYLTVVLEDGPSGQLLGRERFSMRVGGYSVNALRGAVLRRLATRLIAAMSPRVVQVSVELFDCPGLAQVARAIELADAGRWTDARALLEAARTDPATRGLPARTRARLIYNIGQARRFGPRADEPDFERLLGAQRAFEAAMRLAPDPAFTAALAEVRQQRVAADRLAATRAHAQDGSAHRPPGSANPPGELQRPPGY